MPDTIVLANPGADLYGSDRMALKTVEALVLAGHRVVVTSPDEGPLLDLARHAGAETVLTPTPVLRKSALSPRGLIRLAWHALRSVGPGWRLLRRERPSALVVNTITPPLWFVLARLARVPVICHAHEAEASLPRPLKTLLTAPVLLADHLVANSQYCLDVLTQTLPRLRTRATVVHNAVDGPEVLTPPRDRLDGPVHLLYVGRLSARKGVDVAVAAVARLRERGVEAKLVLIGAVFPGNEQYLRELTTSIEQNDLGSRVVRAGFRADRWPATAEADIAVVPSIGDESFGNVVIEAALAARPQVVTDGSGLREAATGITSAIRVSAGDASELADAVQAICADWPTYRTAAMSDAEALAKRFATSRYAAEFNTVIEMVTATHNLAQP